MADNSLEGYYINPFAFQPAEPTNINLPPPPTFDFQTSPAPTYNPSTAFGPSVVTGQNTANLNRPVVPSSVPDYFSTDTPGQKPPQSSIGNNPTTGLPTDQGISQGPATSLGPVGDSFTFNDPNSQNAATYNSINQGNFDFFGLSPVSGGDGSQASNPANTTASGTGSNTPLDLPGQVGQSLGLPDWLTTPNNPVSSIFNTLGGGSVPTSGTDGSTGTASGNSFYQGILDNTKDFIVRFGLILLAIALIAVAAWALSKGGLQRQASKLIAA